MRALLTLIVLAAAGAALSLRYFIVKTLQIEGSTTGLYWVSTPQWQNVPRQVETPFTEGTKIFADENALPFEALIDLMQSQGQWVALGLFVLAILVFSIGRQRA